MGTILPQSSVPIAGTDSMIIAYSALETFGNLVDGHKLVHTPNTTHHLDDKSVPLLGLRHTSILINTVGVVGIIGAWNSAVSKQVAALAGAFGLPQISGASTSPTLSEKKNFPAFVRCVSNDRVALSIQADVVHFYGWKKVAIMTTDDAFAFDGATVFRRRAEELGITIATFEVVPFGIDRLNKRDVVVQKLHSIMATDARIIVMTAVLNDGRVVLEEADKLNLLGKKYSWLGANGWSYSALQGNGAWSGVDNSKLVGILGLGLKFNTEGEDHKMMLAGYKSTAKSLLNRDVTEPDLWAPMYWDTVKLLAYAMNKTISRLNNLSIDLNCLNTKFFPKNQSCWIPESERDAIFQSSTSNKYNGVKEYMQLLKKDEDTYGPLARQSQVVLLEEMYKTDIAGATLQIKLDENGDSFSNFEIVNFQVKSAKRSDSGEPRAPAYEWVGIGVVNRLSSEPIKINIPTQFSGSTETDPVLVATDDGVATVAASSSSSLPMYIGIGAGVGGAIIIALIVYWRVQVMRREAEMNSLKWLVDAEDVELQKGAVGAASRSALSVGSAKSLNSQTSQATRRLKLDCQLAVVNGETYVAKFVIKPDIDLRNRDLLRDMFLLREVRHSNLNQFHGFVVSPLRVCSCRSTVKRDL